MAVRRVSVPAPRSIVGWGLFVIVLPYAAFALSSAAAELLHQMGGVGEVKERSAPLFFVVHALAGTMALVAGALQWVRATRHRNPVHRGLGRAYVLGVLVSAGTAVRMAVTFDVPVAARLSFGILGVL